MKYLTIAVALLLSAQAIKLDQHTYEKEHQKNGGKTVDERENDPYDGTAVFLLNDEVTHEVLMSNQVKNLKATIQDPENQQWISLHPKENTPNFVVFFKNGCEPCKNMHDEWIHLADDVRTSGADVNIMAVDKQYNDKAVQKLEIEHYPTIRLYQGKTFKEFKYNEDDEEGKDLNEKNFQAFLAQNGIKTPDQLKQDKEAAKPITMSEIFAVQKGDNMSLSQAIDLSFAVDVKEDASTGQKF